MLPKNPTNHSKNPNFSANKALSIPEAFKYSPTVLRFFHPRRLAAAERRAVWKVTNWLLGAVRSPCVIEF
jgi:hypothetical protein